MAIEQIGAAQEFELEKEQYGHEAVEPERLIGSIEALPVTFDPEEELRQIRGIGGSEGLRQLEAFRAKLLENKEQLADVQTELISFIRENVDMPIEDIMSYALALAYEKNFSQLQQEIILDTLDMYSRLHAEVEKFWRDYPDKKRLYKDLFKREPKGEIEVIKGPMTLMIRCYDLDDFAHVDSLKWAGKDELKEEDLVLTPVDRMASIDTRGLSLEDYDGIILLENASLILDEDESARVLQHEEQHAIARLFEDSTRLFESESMSSYSLDALNEIENDEEKQKALTYYFRVKRQKYEDMAGDELMAQIAGGVKADDELVELMTKTNGIYDYAHRENSFLGTWRQIAEEAIGAEYASTVDEVVNEVFEKEYKQCIASAVEAIAKLSENGYSTAKIIGLLLHEPLRRWPKLVTDLLASQKSHQLEHAS